MALLRIAEELGTETRIVRAVVEVNEARKHGMADKVIGACGGTVQGKTIGVLGLTFKPNTDDMREAPSLAIIQALQGAGAKVQAYDPIRPAEAAQLLPGVDLASDAEGAMRDADALVIVTEWDEFRALDWLRVKALLKAPVLVDLRNIYAPREMAALGFHYVSVGRPVPVSEGSA